MKLENNQQHSSTEIRSVITEALNDLQNRSLIGAGSLLLGFFGLAVTVFTNDRAFGFLKENGSWLGIIMLLVAIVMGTLISKRSNHTGSKG